MRAHLLALVGLAICVSGCGVARRAQENEDRAANLQSAAAVCNSGKFKTKLEYAQCIGAAEEMYLAPGSPAPDLIRVKIATRNAIAAKLDAGKITQAEADLETAQAASGLVAEVNRRSTSARIAAAQEDLADASTRRGRPVTCIGGPAIASCF